MTIRHLASGVSAVALAAAALFGVSSANATEGYFQTGYGTIQKAQSGAGVANPEDAMSLSVNPAGLVSVGNQFNAAFTLFSPLRDVTATGAGGMLPEGKTTSGSNIFLMPNMAYSRQIDAQSAWGVAIFGNGGMNTDWPGMARPLALCGGGTGLFCGGASGVNLEQMFVSVGYARKMGDFSIGVAPVVALQKFRADGLAAFSAASADPLNFTNRGDDWAYGAGVRVGAQWNLTPTFRIGLSGQTPIWSTKFSHYAGLFADGGSFDIPGNVTAGLAWDAMPGLTLMADYRHIFYGSVPAIANTSIFLGFPTNLLGSSTGPGFGWRDVDVISLAASYKATQDLTLRVGYSHNTNPVRSEDAMFNIFAPGIVTDHVSAGFSWQMTKNSGFDFAFAYVPRANLYGKTLPQLAGFGYAQQDLKLSMEQYEVSLGYSYKF